MRFPIHTNGIRLGGEVFVNQTDEEAELAYALMSEWQWEYRDPDGNQSFHSIELSNAVNRLAMQGHTNPKRAILRLLCQGKLNATCDYEWKKYQTYDRFALSGSAAEVSQNQWQGLANALAEESRALKDPKVFECKVDLSALDVKDCKVAIWEPSYNRFSYALRATDIDPFGPGYFEEIFSAWEIMLMPLMVPAENCLDDFLFCDDTNDAKSDTDILNGKPLSESELNKWWQGKTKVRDLLTKDELLTLIKAKYPDKHISRDRFYEFVGPRTRGKKPFSGKSPGK